MVLPVRTVGLKPLHIKPDVETDVVVHMKGIGNKEYKNITKDTLIGTTGQNRRLEAIRITGHALRLEAIRINPYGKTIKAKVHIQSKGWVDYGMITKDTIIGTVGEKKRIECLCFEGDFEYRVHIQSFGWTDWTKADGVATLGTVGQELRIEAIQFR